MTPAPTTSPESRESRDLEGLFAVVVNWNGGEENQACLRSLLEAGLGEGQILFVDNGSSDGSREAVGAAFPGLRYIDNGANLGFGEGANQGARAALEAGASHVIFVNNDVTVPMGTLERLLEELSREARLGVVAPRVLYAGEEQRVWCAGGRLDWRQNLSTLLGHGEPDGPHWRESRDVDYVAGCAMLVRVSVLEEVGLLEADYFAYMEDVEFCLRVRRAGHGVRTVGEVHVWHAPSSATGGGYNPRRKYMQGVNSVHFLRRWGSARAWLRFLVFDVLSLLPLLLLAPLRGRTRAVLAKGLGILDGLRGRRVEAERLEPGGSLLW